MRLLSAFGPWILWIFIVLGFSVVNSADATHMVGIAGGRISELKRIPWQAALFLKEDPGRGPFCGGSLIDRQYILTAAHCVRKRRKSDVLVRMGEFNWREDEQPMHADYEIDEVIQYRKISNSSMCHDIALLKLTEEVKLDSHIEVIPLVEDDAGFEGKLARISGWGALEKKGRKPARLREIDVEISKLPYSFKNCKRHKNAILAGTEKGKGFCPSDSGGPLTVKIDGKRHLLGVAVKSRKGCYSGLYMRVSFYLEWIKRKTR